MRRAIYLIIGLALICAQDSAAEIGKKEKKPELPKSGLLSSTGDAGYTQKSISGPWADSLGTGAAPVSGSCSKLSGVDWLMRIFNSSKDEYSVDLQVVLRDADGKKLKTENYSYRLKAGQNEERKVYGATGSQTCDLALLSWKKKERREPRIPQSNQAEIEQGKS